MLSICVPVYNFNVIELIISLDDQAKESGIDYEIIVIDDCSDMDKKSMNNELASMKSVLYIELKKNIGRSAIRNLLLNYSKFEYLLFLDCDSQISDSLFIANYIMSCNHAEKVICGGRIYPPKQKSRQYNLRWKYGALRECIPAKKRELIPYKSFMTNNFVIHRNVLEKIKFDEKLTGYGHEDSLFGYRLMQNKVPVVHIQNPVVHDYSETYSEYLNKTRQGLENLYFIRNEMKLGAEFDEMIKLLKVYNRFKKNCLQMPLYFLFYVSNPFIQICFRFGIVNLKVFDFYKLGYFIKICLKPTKSQ